MGQDSGMINICHAAKPCIGLDCLLCLLFAARWLKLLVKRLTRRHRQARNLGMVLGRLSQGIVILVGLFVALSIVIPTFKGRFGSIAGHQRCGNWFRLPRYPPKLSSWYPDSSEPFRLDDQIVFKEFEGTVENIQTRATTIRTYDGRRIVIPNSELFTNSVTVNTAFENRRLSTMSALRRRHRLGEAVNAGSNPQRERGLEIRPDAGGGTCGK